MHPTATTGAKSVRSPRNAYYDTVRPGSVVDTDARRRRYDEVLPSTIGESRLREAESAWRTLLDRVHGDAFAGADVDLGRCFRDLLYYDFLVARAVDRTAAAAGLTVMNPGTDCDAFDVGDCHRAVVEAGFDPDPGVTDPADLDALYRNTVPAATRRAFGEYYTPPGIAAVAVDEALDGVGTVLDPGCGAGAFLVAAVRHLRERGVAPEDCLASVCGVDVNPVAVRSAKAALLVEIADELDGSVALPVVHGDSLGLIADLAPDVARADAVVGNPPWIPWERLPERVKERWRNGPIDRLGLFEHTGADARLGFANDDIGLSFALTCTDRYRRAGGRAAFVLKRDLLVGPTGRPLRGDDGVGVVRIHDFGSCRPFPGVDADAALFVLGENAPESVPATEWTATDDRPRFDSWDAMESTLDGTETAYRPVADPGSAWVRADAERQALGTCEYRIRHGVKDDAKAVFSLGRETARSLEPDHVFPYLRSKHVVKFGLFGHDLHLVPERRAGDGDAERLRRDCPRTYDYLDERRDRLDARGSSWFDAGPFYSLFGVGPYTWADYKVVWCRLGFKPHFAVVSTVVDPDLGERPVVPGDHCMFVATDDGDEAHYLCALLNSAPYQRCLRDLAEGGKASLTKTVVSELSLPTWTGTDEQRRLAALSRDAHDLVPAHVAAATNKRAYNDREKLDVSGVQRDIDRVAATLLDRLNENA
jgi:hypothetical protein